MSKNIEYRLYDFKISNEITIKKSGAIKETVIQMFGLNEKGETASIFVKNFEPFFYIKVGDDWNERTLEIFKKELQMRMAKPELYDKYKKWQCGKIVNLIPSPLKDEDNRQYVERNMKTFKTYHFKGISDMRLVKRHKLYGFDNKKMHNFIAIIFKNTTALNKVKNLWYDRISDRTSLFGYSQTLKTVNYFGYDTELYEAKLPPLLRFFHLKSINPSGWIQLPRNKYKKFSKKKTNCDFEYSINWNNIVPMPEKETAVPLKICSFDIEASSSHGDFPMAIKTYKKLAGDIITHWNKNNAEIKRLNRAEKRALFKRLIMTAFGYSTAEDINCVYPKEKVSKEEISEHIDYLLREGLKKLIKRFTKEKKNKIKGEDEDEELYSNYQKWGLSIKKNNSNGESYKIIDCLNEKLDAGKKLEIIDFILTGRLSDSSDPDDDGGDPSLPYLQGDKVTFIGSTFILAGESTPYLNHGICLNTCSLFDMPKSDVEIIECDDESDVLKQWTEIIQREKPHIIIGYNIFGFDYRFMCDRATENNCFNEFCMLGKNKNIKCQKLEKTIKIASGAHELTYMKIDGIVQIDLYNYFRREVNLGSYKLQDVASHFIGDMISDVTVCKNHTVIKSQNLMGLQEGNFVIFEIIGHSKDEYKKGTKFQVIRMDEKKCEFWVKEEIIMPVNKKLRWGLGKDDVSPADLFRLANGTEDDRAIIAKYCFQDCNLVHHLLRKNDVVTGMTEIAAICSVPIDFIVMRGQGIKLLSFIAKKCREKLTLMPVMEKTENGGSYEGAICLPPKKGFYTDDPVAVVDYASLYPSSMISENISHDSKVWTQEFDLKGILLRETGHKQYDNLPGYEYVDIEYDRYEWIAPEDKKKEVKVKVGTKICRFAQFPNNKKAIMPSILQELLQARQATRILIKYKTVTLKNGDTISGLIKELEKTIEITNKSDVQIINKDDIVSTKDTYNDFMKNVFDARQQGFKVTANSLYGQCGAKTSAFYDIDIAASTTATGRKLLIYGKKVIEEVYHDRICVTKYGEVRSKAEYIYGDTDSVFFTFNLEELGGKKILGKKALEITIELAIEAGKLASQFLKSPHDLEYEKTFHPFLLLSKKRYVGMLYEKNPNKCKRKSMGIVLKRRDNADVVKDIYGGNIDILMSNGNVSEAMNFTKNFLKNIVDGNIDLKKLIVSKSLRGWYKNPDSIAHNVLAERMGKRDAGNKPAVGSRIPYVYFQTNNRNKKVKQGDRIEHPDYMIEKKLKPDYVHYITNQIQKPITQIYALVLEQMPQFKTKVGDFKRRLRMLDRKHKDNPEKRDSEETKIRNAEVKKILFDTPLRQANNMKNGQQTILKFLRTK
jgi:DNA polymerase elongation subunit (family B)